MTRITKLLATAALSILVGLTGLAARAQNANAREVLWYRTPTPVWDRALPIGNGRLGTMEHLQLNESTLWNGSRTDRLNPHAKEAFLSVT
jgi:alpha-L-fucosidase 2